MARCGNRIRKYGQSWHAWVGTGSVRLAGVQAGLGSASIGTVRKSN
jgi:hypothetical protein